MISENSQPEISVLPRDLAGLIAAGRPVQLLDVRTPGEYAAGHVPGARLVPLDDLDPKDFINRRPAGPVYVLCQSGGRARKAIEKLHDAGFSDCVLVEGGTQAWVEAGLPVDCDGKGGLPLMRQVQIIVGAVSGTGALLALTVDRWFAVVPLVMGCGLLFAGITGFCGLALLLAKMPWNRLRPAHSCCEPKEPI